jgi:IS30 family transposase
MANELKVAKVLSIKALHAQGWSQRRIARELGINRESVARHLRSDSKPARAPTGSDDSKPAIAPPGSEAAKPGSKPAKAPAGSGSLCEPWRAEIEEKLGVGLSAQRIFQDLVSDYDFAGRYHSVRRFVAKLRQADPLPFRRMEVAPRRRGSD